MTFLQFLCALRRYKVDVLLLAPAVSLLTALLKKTAPEKIPKKVFVFAPFLIGTLAFAIYRMIATASVSPLTETFGETAEGGLSCGSAATILYVAYEQFLRRKKSSPVAPFLEGVVPEAERQRVAEELFAGAAARDKDALYGFLLETLKKSALPACTEEELAACAKAVELFLLSLQKE